MASTLLPTGQPGPLLPGEFQSQTQARKVSFATTHLTPPTQLYVTTDEQILVNAYTSVAGAALKVSFKILFSDGSINHSEQTFQLTSARAVNQIEIPLQEGFLFAVDFFASGSANVRRGQMYAAAAIEFGSLGKGAFVHPIFADYLAFNTPTGWPQGPIRQSIEGPGMMLSLNFAAPAAGADFSITVPTGARWRLQALNALFTTSATVATRTVEFAITDGAGSGLHRFVAGATQAASLANRYTLENGVVFNAIDTTQVMIPMGTPLMLFQGWKIISSTVNIQAGAPQDTWSSQQLLVEEWLEN